MLEKVKPKIFPVLDDAGKLIIVHGITAAARWCGRSRTLLLKIAKGEAHQMPQETIDKVLKEYPELTPQKLVVSD